MMIFAQQKMAAITACNCSPSGSSLSTHKPFNALHRSNSFKSISFSNKTNPNHTCTRLRIYGVKAVVPKRAYRVLAVSESNSEAGLSDSNKDATIDIKLPRRSLLVQFTCNECGERTERLINRLAYERGVVFVQCAGCQRHHKLVDNLGIVVEYDFREETNMQSRTDLD